MHLSFAYASRFNAGHAFSGAGEAIAIIAGIIGIIAFVVALAKSSGGWGVVAAVFIIGGVGGTGLVTGLRGSNLPACANQWIPGQSYSYGAEVSYSLPAGQMANWQSNIQANAGTRPDDASGTWTLVGNCSANLSGSDLRDVHTGPKRR